MSAAVSLCVLGRYTQKPGVNVLETVGRPRLGLKPAKLSGSAVISPESTGTVHSGDRPDRRHNRIRFIILPGMVAI